MKRILVLGGKSFIGRNLVEQLIINSDYDITLFNRGKTNPHLFPNLNNIIGDRKTSDIDQIAKIKWDYVIDFSCYYPEHLEAVIDKLKETLKNYIFISTCSVYDNAQDNPTEESYQTLPCTESQKIDATMESYGNRKAECERILKQSNLPYTILRPALVYGQHDPTDRFYYWLYQVNTKDKILIPESGKRLFSITYVHDLTNCIIKTLESPFTDEIYNVISQPQISISQIVETSKSLLNRQPQLINVSSEFLKKENINQWTDIPLWINSDNFTFTNQKAETQLDSISTEFIRSVEDTIQYYEDQNWHTPKYGISEEVKMGLIDKLSN